MEFGDSAFGRSLESGGRFYVGASESRRKDVFTINLIHEEIFFINVVLLMWLAKTILQ
jgi:hypothetical protein